MKIYFDNAATTCLYKDCLKEMDKYLIEEYYNPSALYSKASVVTNNINQARNTIAKLMGAKSEEIIFTGSGSESDNCAIFCSLKNKKGRIIVSATEHAAIFNSACELKSRGYDVIFTKVDKYGRVLLDEFKKNLTDDTIFVSIMHVCNETGALNDIKKLVKLTKSVSPHCIFHSDGVQAFGKLNLNVHELDVDLYSISAHKIHGPKGIGALYIKKGVSLKPFVYGGGQEKNIRSATENVPSIIAFAKAAEIKKSIMNSSLEKMKEIQKIIIDKLSTYDCIINTDINNSSPYIVSASFNNIRGETILHALEEEEIIIGTGSACSAKKSNLRIQKALGLDSSFQQGNIRISPNETVKKEEIDFLFDSLDMVLNKLKKYKRI